MYSRSLPPGLNVNEITCIPEDASKLQGRVYAAEFNIRINTNNITKLQGEIAKILNSESIPRTRRNKAYDLRPMIQTLELIPDTNEHSGCLIKMTLTAQEGKTGRPDEVLLELGIDPSVVLIERTKIHYNNESQHDQSDCK